MKAFTLVETLVVLGILALLLGLAITPFFNYSRTQSLAASASAVAGALRDARARTLASVSASQYGVKVDSDRFTLFKGSVFASSTAGNEIFVFPYPVLASSSVGTFVFARVTGVSNASGTIDLYLPGSPNIAKKSVSVQSTGLVGIQ